MLVRIFCITFVFLFSSNIAFSAQIDEEYVFLALDNRLCESVRERDDMLINGITTDIEKARYHYLQGKIYCYNECLIFLYYNLDTDG